MGVYLREKKLGGGQVSFYLDIYHNKRRWYEFLEIRINKNHPTQQDKEKRRLFEKYSSLTDKIVSLELLEDPERLKEVCNNIYESLLNERIYQKEQNKK